MAHLIFALQLVLLAYGGLAILHAHMAALAMHGALWPWMEGTYRGLGKLTAPAQELVLHVWPRAINDPLFVGRVVLLVCLTLDFALLPGSWPALAG